MRRFDAGQKQEVDDMRNNEGFDLWAEDYDESVERV